MKTIDEIIRDSDRWKEAQKNLENFEKMMELIEKYPIKPMEPKPPDPPYTTPNPYKYY